MNEPQYRTADVFDKMLGSLAGLPDTTHTKPSTITAFTPIIGSSMTLVIQTFRQREQGDTIFIQYMDADKHVRLVIPPAAADAIARQRDSLTTKIRRKIGKDSAAARKARGELPGFMKKKGKSKMRTSAHSEEKR
jgi:hypothetical protein